MLLCILSDYDVFSAMYLAIFFFFFQAEDGIRDKLVTGVQTCALPISDQRVVAREVIKNVLADSVAALLRHDPLVRTSGDPEAIHQARVATRKLRSHLRTFGPLLDPEWTDPLRTELGWMGLALGAVRDREVLLDRLRERAKELPAHDHRAAASLLSILEREIADLRKKLIVDLDSARYVEMLER